jgi:hypothetical protein
LLQIVSVPEISYRSVHNIRIERLWRDLTRGMGRKWKSFFTSLEAGNLLDPNFDDHIWLLHFLFLPCINQDLQEWAEVWNSHKIRLGDQGKESSPKELFIMGRLEAGFTLDNNGSAFDSSNIDSATYVSATTISDCHSMYRARAAAYIGVLVKWKLSVDEVGEKTSARLGIKLKDG